MYYEKFSVKLRAASAQGGGCLFVSYVALARLRLLCD